MEVESRAPRGRGTPGRPGACKYRAAGGGGAGGRDTATPRSASWARDRSHAAHRADRYIVGVSWEEIHRSSSEFL